MRFHLRALAAFVVDAAAALAVWSLERLAAGTEPGGLDEWESEPTPTYDALTAEWFNNGLTDEALAAFIEESS